jgi:hypothetical protein
MPGIITREFRSSPADPTIDPEERNRMDKSHFDEYIRRFNERDRTAFDDYLAPDMHMTNGTLEFDGVTGMRAHYEKIWVSFDEELHVERYVSDSDTVAIQMWTHFTAHRDDPESLFGKVEKGTTFDFHGLIMYRLRADGLFQDIKVAYNSFTRTDPDGSSVELGVPH